MHTHTHMCVCVCARVCVCVCVVYNIHLTNEFADVGPVYEALSYWCMRP